MGAHLALEAAIRSIQCNPSKQEQSMTIIKASMTWLRRSAHDADFAMGCPPKVDAPDMKPRAVDVPQGCPPKVD